MGVTVGIFINRHHLDKEGNGSVSVRVTHNRAKKYYPLGISLDPNIFDKLVSAKRRNNSEREIFDFIQASEHRAKDVIKELPIFTFGLFEEKFLSGRSAIGTVAGAVDNRVIELKSENKLGTAESYRDTKVSLEKFKKGLKFADITPSLLRKYEKWMLENGKSITTVGIYLRNLRALYKIEKINESIYPFGKGKYEIPTGRNIKKAKALSDVAKIANYEPGSEADAFARDFWILSFQCNGMNMKDILNLKRSNIGADMIMFVREKTANTKREVEKVQVSLKPESREIIKRWGNVIDINDSDPFVFPILKKGMTPTEARRKIKQTTKKISERMKQIGASLGIEGKLTVSYARHCFATILKRSGVSTEFISDALGHSSLTTTKNYLDGFESDAIHQQTDILTGLKKA